MTLLKVGDRGLKVTRHVTAAPSQISAAQDTPEMLRKWMLGAEGWTMPHCELDAGPGGAFSYVLQSKDNERFTMRGNFADLDPPRRIVHTEPMDMGLNAFPRAGSRRPSTPMEAVPR